MCRLTIDIPEEVLNDTNMSKEKAKEYLRKIIAKEFYLENGVSLGYCSEIAGISKEEFIKYLGQHNISIFRFDNQNEFLDELNNVKGYC